ncbi:SDR family NAD(P)-dependent oxidoreductase [candidate division KSB1 bacterium]|nr:SDR family NAD(P)-dependent oxidoreductase [candidate division KSB1 bacterium]
MKVLSKMLKKSSLKDQVIIITGASSGIGRATALRLAQLNARVVLAARNAANLATLHQEIRQLGGQALAIQTDVTSLTDAEHLVQTTLAQWGKIDILIANAGQYIQGTLGAAGDLALFQQSLEVNFYGTLYVIKSVLPAMQQAGKGQIIIMNSLDAKKGIVGDGPYIAAKAALAGLGDALRQELHAQGITVTSIFPARVDTPMIREIQVPWISPKMAPEKVVQAILRGIKSQRALVMVPGIHRLLGVLNECFPRLVDWFYKIFKIEGHRL